MLISQSNRNYYVYYPNDVTEELGIAAIRLNQYKAHFHSHGYIIMIVYTCVPIRIYDLDYIIYNKHDIVKFSTLPMHRYLCQNIYPDPVCRDNYTLHYYDPPLLYDLHSDPSEIYNLNVSDYEEVMSQINTVKSPDYNNIQYQECIMN